MPRKVHRASGARRSVICCRPSVRSGPTSVVGPASVVGPTSVVGPAAVAVEPAVEEVLGGFFGSGGLKLPCSAASTKGYSGGVVGTASPKITTGVPGAASGASGASVGSRSPLFPLHFPSHLRCLLKVRSGSQQVLRRGLAPPFWLS